MSLELKQILNLIKGGIKIHSEINLKRLI